MLSFSNIIKQKLLKRDTSFFGDRGVLQSLIRAKLAWFFIWFNKIPVFIFGACAFSEDTLKTLAQNGYNYVKVKADSLELDKSMNNNLNAWLYTTIFPKENANKAKEKLLKANELTGGKSSQVLYFLGLNALKLNQVADAKYYAKEAKKLGYPLAGLQKKIEELEK